jgi:parallel beta-helix repeat protein
MAYPMRLLLVLLAATTLSAQNLRVTSTPPETIEKNQPATWRITIENVSGTDLPSAPVHFSFSFPVEVLAPELGCTTVSLDNVRCTLPALAPGQSLTVDAVVVTPFRYGRITNAVVVLYKPEAPERADFFSIYWKDYFVTTTADSGPGSLRQTILDINRECQSAWPDWTSPCRAAFRITEPIAEGGWHTIRPLTPLPAVNAYDVGIDGTTQTQSNSRGPSIALDGSALTAGDGLTHAQPNAMFLVRGLAIGGFPGDGVQLTTGYPIVRDNYIGVDPTGQRASPNGLRGISSSVMTGAIVGNVISGNTRSGVFFMTGSGTGPSLRNNRIGVAAHDDTPIGNGASGIFIGDFFGYYANPTIEGNVIANNGHFGIALTANAPMLILGNSIRDNGAAGIDIDLDGRTEGKPGIPGVTRGVIPPPVITSAIYANGVTTITGVSTAGNRRQVLLYANAQLEDGGFAEGEQYLGATAVQFGNDTAFTFVYPGDLRGKFINGTSQAVTSWSFDESSFTPSEFGRAVPVQSQ